MGKKKATGMSKRLGFTDRATINENKDILRYNDRLEREAQGLPPEEPRGRAPRAGNRPDGGRAQNGDVQRTRPEGARRPPRQARPPRPPALDEEQTATLTTAYHAVVGESGLEPAADKVIERLAAHDSFERATMAGWDVAAGAHAGERTAPEWELLRTAWLSVRLALLESYAAFKPEAAEALAREQKQQARLAKPPRPRRRPGNGPDKRRPAKSGAASGPRTPSPADVARHVAAHGSTPEEATAALTAAAAPEASAAVAPSPEGAPGLSTEEEQDPGVAPTDVVAPAIAPGVEPSSEAGRSSEAGPSHEAEPSPDVAPDPPHAPERDVTATEGADPETDVAVPDAVASSSDEEPADPPITEQQSADVVPAGSDHGEAVAAPEAAAEPSAPEHEVYGSPSETQEDRPDDGQLALDL